MKRCICFIAAFCLLIETMVLPLPTFSQTNKQTKPSFLAETSDGLFMARLVTPEGFIWMNFPDEIAAGDTISGTVFVDPSGANAAEKAQNLSVLNGYVFDLGDGNKVSADKPGFSWVPQVPKTSAPVKYVNKVVEVLAKNGEKVASANIPVLTATPPAAPNVTFPVLAQTGRPVQIAGPFDGIASNTTAVIGGGSVNVIAESPRKTIVRAPANATGPSQITVVNGGKVSAGEIRVVGIALSAPKTNLMKGETTSLTVTVLGLQNLANPIAVNIVTTGSVNMSGGNVQTLLILPGQVGLTGNFVQTYTLTGTQPGGFGVNASVVIGGSAGDKNNKN